MTSTITKGFEAVVAMDQNTGTWGSGSAALLGSGDGVELLSEGLKMDVQLIANEAVSGQATQLPGATGAELHAGPMAFNAYYQNGGVDVAVACLFGSVDAAAQQGGTTAYKHVHRIAENHEGKFLTGVIDEQTALREYPFMKVVGGEFMIENKGVGKWTFDMAPFSLNLNRGTADSDYFVVAVDLADGALTLAQTTLPTTVREGQLVSTLTDANNSVTEFLITYVVTHARGHLLTLYHRLTTDGKVKTFPDRIAGVVSATVSETAGTVGAGVDRVTVGYTPGINNASTITSVSLPTQRDFVNFEQLEVLCNDQDGAALASTDELFVSAFRLKLSPNMVVDDVTTRFGYLIEEPVKDGFYMVEVGLTLSRKLNTNVDLVLDHLRKKRKKMKVTLTGPLADSPYAYSWTFWLNNVQFTDLTSQVDGAKRVGLDITGMAQRALAIPSGWPTGYTKACYLETITKRSTNLLA